MRPIIDQFVLSSDVGAILKNRSLLLQNSVRGSLGQKVYITRDNPEEIVKVQNYLRPVLKLAKRVDKDSHISRDKLIFKGKAIDLKGCYAIPELEVEKTGLVQKPDAVLFHGRYCPFSNFFPCEFVIGGTKYNCVEQYFQKKRADYSGMFHYSHKISNSTDPAEMKVIVKPVDKSFWPKDLQYNAMKEALLAKFQQNEKLGALRKGTGDCTMIECNMHDAFSGNGLSIFDKNARYGTGQNKLGALLEEVRSLLY